MVGFYECKPSSKPTQWNFIDLESVLTSLQKILSDFPRIWSKNQFFLEKIFIFLTVFIFFPRVPVPTDTWFNEFFVLTGHDIFSFSDF